MQNPYRNHSWVSFQGFCEAYNDSYNLNSSGKWYGYTFLYHYHDSCKHQTHFSELSPTLVGEAFYNGEVENELRRINRIDYLFKKIVIGITV